MDEKQKTEIKNLITGDPSELPGEVVADTEPTTIVVTDEMLDNQPIGKDPYEICVGHGHVSEDESNARE
jgi:hypothetical protein